MKYAICNETFQEMNWEQACAAASVAGYDGIEVAPFTLAQDVRELDPRRRMELAETARANGLEIVGLHWLLVSPAGLSVTSPDRSIRGESADYLAALTRFCHDVGGSVMVLGSPAQRRLPVDVAPADAERAAEERLLECLAPALSVAADFGITICLEPLPAPEADFVLTLESAVAIIARSGHPGLKTIFDVKSASSESRPLPDLIRAFAPFIAHVHANDANRKGPGFGDTDYVPIFSALTEVGYRGYVSVEVFDYTPDAMTIATGSRNYMRRCDRTMGRHGE